MTSQLPPTFHESRFNNNVVPTTTAPAVNATRPTYTAYPPAKLRSTEYVKSEVDTAGPTARVNDTVVCASPFVAPR
jgi:hypothetical protein